MYGYLFITIIGSNKVAYFAYQEQDLLRSELQGMVRDGQACFGKEDRRRKI